MGSAPSGSDEQILPEHGVVSVLETRRVICNRQSKIYNPKLDCQGGEIGRRARLRIAKSSISERRFSLQSERVLRMEKQFSE
jgi:hypothetical protein